MLGVDLLSRFPFIWVIHVAVILYFGSAVLLLRSEFPGSLTALQANLPTWVLLVDGLVFAYMTFNFFLCMSLTGGGNADLVNGQYLLMSHGRIIEHLSRGAYHLHKAYELRMFSGAWLAFWAIGSGHFLFWKHVPVRSTNRLLA